MQHSNVDTRAKWRKICDEAKYPYWPIPYAGFEFGYYVYPKEKMPPNLQLGIMQFTPTWEEWTGGGCKPDDIFFIVSEVVPEDFRMKWTLHELLEYFHAPQAAHSCEACGLASAMEVGAVLSEPYWPREKMHTYLKLRHRFFRELIAYARGTNRGADEIEQFEHSERFFAATCARLGIVL